MNKTTVPVSMVCAIACSLLTTGCYGLRIHKTFEGERPESEIGVLRVLYPILLGGIDGRRLPSRFGSPKVDETERVLFTPGPHTVDIVVHAVPVLPTHTGLICRVVFTDSTNTLNVLLPQDKKHRLVPFQGGLYTSVNFSLSLNVEKAHSYRIEPNLYYVSKTTAGPLWTMKKRFVINEMYWDPSVIDTTTSEDVTRKEPFRRPFLLPTLVTDRKNYDLVVERCR